MLGRSLLFISICEAHRKYDNYTTKKLIVFLLSMKFGQHTLDKMKPCVWRKTSSSMSSKNTDT